MRDRVILMLAALVAFGASLGQAEVARRDFEHALQIDPCAFDPRYNLRSLGVAALPPRDCRFTPDEQRRLQ